ncbi:hypothetical protein TURTL08_01910 [Turicimonas sp. TL08]
MPKLLPRIVYIRAIFGGDSPKFIMFAEVELRKRNSRLDKDLGRKTPFPSLMFKTVVEIPDKIQKI